MRAVATLTAAAAPMAAAPVAQAGPGSPASPFTDAQVASISRVASANDPQGRGPGSESPGRGGPNDRNVEAMLRDPRKLK